MANNNNRKSVYHFYRSMTPVQFEEVDDDTGAIDIEDLPQNVQDELQSQMPQFFITTPNPEDVDFEQMPYSADFAPSVPLLVIGVTPTYRKLFGIRVPEYKVATCKKTFKTPFGKVKFNYPCLKTRTSELNVYAYVFFPTHLQDFIKAELQRCLDIASRAASSAAIGTFMITPGTPFERTMAALSTGSQTFQNSFVECVKSIPSWDTIRRNVDYGVTYEQIRLDDWH